MRFVKEIKIEIVGTLVSYLFGKMDEMPTVLFYTTL